MSQQSPQLSSLTRDTTENKQSIQLQDFHITRGASFEDGTLEDVAIITMVHIHEDKEKSQSHVNSVQETAPDEQSIVPEGKEAKRTHSVTPEEVEKVSRTTTDSASKVEKESKTFIPTTDDHSSSEPMLDSKDELPLFDSKEEIHPPKQCSTDNVNFLTIEEADRKKPQKYVRHVQIASCITWVTMNLTYTYLSPFFSPAAEERGLAAIDTGIIFAVFQFAVLFATPLVNHLCVALSPQVVFVMGLVIEGISQCAFAFFHITTGKTFLVICVIARIVQGVGSSFSQTGSMSLILNVVPSEQVSITLVALEVAAGVGVLLGPLFGSLLYDYIGWIATFIIGGVLLFLMTFYVMFVTDLDTGRRSESNNEKSAKKSISLLQLLRIPRICLAFSVLLTGFAVATFLDPLLPIRAEEGWGLSVIYVGLLFTINTASYAIAGVAATYLMKKINTEIILIAGSVFMVLSLFGLGPAPFLSFLPPTSLVLFCVSLLANGVGASLAATPATAYMNTTLDYVRLEKSQVAERRALADFNKFQDLEAKLIESKEGDGVRVAREEERELWSKDQASAAIGSLSTAAVALGSGIGPLLGSSVMQVSGFGWSTTSFALWSILLVFVQITFFVFATPLVPINSDVVDDVATIKGDSETKKNILLVMTEK